MKRFIVRLVLVNIAAFILGFGIGTVQQAITAQQKPEEPKEIIKAFPPVANQKFTEAQKEIELAQARLANAQANLRLVLYAIADEMELTKAEKETCPFAQTANGTWVFKCPPAKVAEAKKPEKPPEIKPKE